MTALHETSKSISSDEEGSEMNPRVVSEMVQFIVTTLLNVNHSVYQSIFKLMFKGQHLFISTTLYINNLICQPDARPES